MESEFLLFFLLVQDVGQAILESYSRVLEGLAFNIMAWIEDVLYADAQTPRIIEKSRDFNKMQPSL